MSFIANVTAERRADAQVRAAAGAIELVQQALADAKPTRDFLKAVSGPPLKLIAEIKRASPAKGLISPDADAIAIAAEYEHAGAAAISVLTEPQHFGGSLEDLAEVAGKAGVPVLRKDFICEPLQVLEARAAGADAVLLIVAALQPDELSCLIELTHELGMTADVEVHDEAEVDIAIEAGARLIAINARNLATLEVDLAQIERVRPRIPNGVPVVAESGISSREDVDRMRDAGVDAVHIGELLMRSADRKVMIQSLMSK